MPIVPRWEWRAFGDEFGEAERRLAAGQHDALEESDEAYIISAARDASVKLRAGVLDVKRLEQIDDAGLEQWRPVLKGSFPMSPTDIATIKAALGVHVDISVDTLDELLAAEPGVMALDVHKRRARSTYGGCMAELTEFTTSHGATRTLAVESTDRAQLLVALHDLGLDARPNICVARGLKALVGLDGDRYGVIDVGTNSVKLHVAERVAGQGWQTLADRAEITRLGEGLEAGGSLGAEPMRRTVEAIAAMAREAAAQRARAVLAIGTAGLRTARNADAFLAAVREQTGVVVEVLTGDDEARLAARAATDGLPARPGTSVIFDTGGGSSQFTFARDGTLQERFSVDLGAVRLTRDFGLADAVPATRVDEACSAIAGELIRLNGRARPSLIVGIGGAMTNLAAVRHGLRSYDPELVQGTVLDTGEIDRQITLFRTLDATARAALPGVQPARAEVILAGACIVRTVLRMLGGDAVVVSDRGLRHGVLAERFATEHSALGGLGS